MARIRTIKPEFFTSEDIVGLSPLARLLYIATWCEADREGRMAWKPKTLKFRYFPADACDIDALARELVDAGLIVPYGAGLAFIPKFASHQHLNPREAESKLPEPDASSRVSDASLPVIDAQVGREGKGREGKGGVSDASPKKRAPAKHTLPPDFCISERVREWAKSKGHDRLEDHLESFKGKAAAKGYTYSDWDSAFMEAVRENWAKLAPTQAVSQPGGGRREL